MLGRINSTEAVREGIGALFPRLWRYCVVLTGSRDGADDLAQAACLKAIEKSDMFQIGTHLDRWVFKVAQRLWIDDLRKQSVRLGGGLVAVEEVDLVDTAAGPEENLLGREVMQEVLNLPEAQRSAVFLVYVEGNGYKEAAEILDIPIGTVMSRLAGARSKIGRKFVDESNT